MRPTRWMLTEGKGLASKVWAWAGRWDDRLGRLRILRWAVYAVALIVLVAVVLLSILVGAIAAILLLVFAIVVVLVLGYIAYLQGPDIPNSSEGEWTTDKTLAVVGLQVRYGRAVLWEIEAHALKWGRKDSKRGFPWMEATNKLADLYHGWMTITQKLLDKRVGEPHASLFSIETDATPPFPKVVRESVLSDDEQWGAVWHRIKRLEKVMEHLSAA